MHRRVALPSLPLTALGRASSPWPVCQLLFALPNIYFPALSFSSFELSLRPVVSFADSYPATRADLAG
jgi:hypothetical protein